MKWTRDAKTILKNYLSDVKKSVDPAEANPKDVSEDLHGHIVETLLRKKLRVIGDTEVQEVIKEIGFNIKKKAHKEKIRGKAKRIGMFSTTAIIILGVIFPVIAILVELLFRPCTVVFFDPIPTIWHIFVVCIIPLGNLFVLNTIKSCNKNNYKIASVIIGCAIGASLMFIITLFPVIIISGFSVIALFGIFFYGLGIYPFFPVAAIVVSIILSVKLRSTFDYNNKEKSIAWTGIIAVAIFMILINLQYFVTDLGIRKALSTDSVASNKAVEMLRSFGNKKYILMNCYDQRRLSFVNPLSWFSSFMSPDREAEFVNPEDARTVYYRVYGESFNVYSRKDVLNEGVFPGVMLPPFGDFDDEAGNVDVGGKINGINLISSTIDGTIDSDSGIAYSEWFFEFENKTKIQQEARALIALPHGSVATRMTLWVNGEEQEAVFAKKSKVVEAYQSTVRKRRDPSLLTSKGRDRVMLQCYPIAENGGKMKVRIGFTSPMRIEGKGTEALLELPYISDSNFYIHNNVRHSVWYESKNSINSENLNLKPENPDDKLYALRGIIKDTELFEGKSLLRVSRNMDVNRVWSKDVYGSKFYVTQEIVEEKNIIPEKLIVVIDGSKDMKAYIDLTKKAFSTLQVKDIVYVIADKNISIVDLEKISSKSFKGGVDNIPALEKAWDLAGSKSNSAILWIHGGQPMIMSPTIFLEQKWKRRPGKVKLYDLAVNGKRNRISESFESNNMVENVYTKGDVYEDLRSLFLIWEGKLGVKKYVREWVNTRPSEGKQTSDHLARLWAYDKVLFGGSDALEFAGKYKLITHISGAVVLENQNQYEQFGLDKNSGESVGKVPSVPEPEEWIMIIIAMVAVLILVLLGKKTECKNYH
ncbi:MAG: hypothetical protein JXR81_01350 [Candidatus Goldbacteria bacterium]|nr:hypothetical protein [Candidatus Goldiibacteriota bacterium]